MNRLRSFIVNILEVRTKNEMNRERYTTNNNNLMQSIF